MIYRDASGIALGYTSSELKLVPKARVTEKEPNELFTVVDNSYGESIWVERGLLLRLVKQLGRYHAEEGAPKGLELQIGSELVGRP